MHFRISHRVFESWHSKHFAKIRKCTFYLKILQLAPFRREVFWGLWQPPLGRVIKCQISSGAIWFYKSLIFLPNTEMPDNTFACYICNRYTNKTKMFIFLPFFLWQFFLDSTLRSKVTNRSSIDHKIFLNCIFFSPK